MFSREMCLYVFRIPFCSSEVENFFTRMSAVLNDSQAEAIRKVLQYRVALVQGPPGTGKSFLGRKVRCKLPASYLPIDIDGGSPHYFNYIVA